MPHPFSHTRMLQLQDMFYAEAKGELTTEQFETKLFGMGYRVEKYRHHRVLISSLKDEMKMRWLEC